MSEDTRTAVRAVFLAAIMITSVMAAGVAFSGSAAADVTSIDDLSADAIVANDASGDNVDVSGNQFNDAGGDGVYVAAFNRNGQPALGLGTVAGTNTFDEDVVSGDTFIVPDAGQDEVVNINTGERFSSATAIQDAVDNASADNTLRVGPGTYNESVTVDTDSLTIEGSGNSASGTILKAPSSGSGNGITVDASNLTVRNIRITDYSNGIRMKNTHSNIIFENVDSVGNSNRGMEIRNSADLTDLTLNNVDFSNNDRGIRGATTSSVDGLTITDSEFSNNVQGAYFGQSESNPGQLNDVTISDTEFSNNTEKGIYAEKLSNATFDNITVDGVTSDTYGYNDGIDINLKYDDYENITIRDSTVANVSEGDPGNPSASVAVAIKARGSTSDDSGYTSTPAALDGVTIENVVIKDSFNGLRIGEFGKDYSGGGGPTDVMVTDSTFRNNSGYHVQDRSGNLDLAATLNSNANTFDRTVTVEDSNENLTDGIFSSIQTAVNAAESGDAVSADSSTYEENVNIDTENVTVEGEHDRFDPDGDDDGTIIEGLVTLSAPDTELRETRVAPPTFDGDESNTENQAVLVTATGATVDENTIEINVTAPSGYPEGQAVQVFASDGSPISDVVVSDNRIIGEGISADGTPGVVGVNDQANTEKTLVVNNDIDVESEGYSFGVVTRASSGEDSTPNTEVLFNDITALGGTLNGVGYGVESTDEAQVDAGAQLVKYNTFENIDSIEHKASSGTLDLTVNKWEDPGSVQFLTNAGFFDSPQKGGEIVFDPVLTEEKSVNDFDALLTETDERGAVATTRDYGSYLQLASNGEPATVGFSAKPDGNLSQVLPETLVSGSEDTSFAFYVYDNDAQTFVPVNGSYTPSAGEVVVIAASGGYSEDFVVPVDAGDGNLSSLEPPGIPSSVDINEGWNLIATGAANSDEDLTTGSEILVGAQIQTQPRQPGAPAAGVKAYDGTWIFAGDDGALTTGYVEGQPPVIYSELVLTPDTDDSNDDEES